MPFAAATVAPRVLVVDDHRKIREPLATYLRRHTFEVRTAEDAAGMWQLLKTQAFDVVVLDVLLPDGDGFELCSQLHRRSNTPVILLTARDAAADRIRGLDLGADDYVTKPFEPRELVARINSVLRRQGRNTGPAAPATGVRAYRFSGWHFSVASALLTREATPAIQLSTAESRLLQVFLKHPSSLLPRERLIDLTAAADSDVSDRAIDRQVSRLRRKLAQGDETQDLLRTIWGGGYLLAAEVSECAP
ncbi:response regulator transcription factor [Pseudomonas sp. P115]|uniref:response regulator transcription factor n=1 Tax=Pseudomonas pisciculturae TaxID=2730413 RepID=UPI0018924CC3|nr:response regulator transcription factor [Pseudomonas pisciculturae]MBF6031564.1 response regulator transcription factor [Pseudomonas pisciculturae]